ncbi:MAG: chromosomal replication initiator protein DnaA [Candidatus Binatia bacterium]
MEAQSLPQRAGFLTALQQRVPSLQWHSWLEPLRTEVGDSNTVTVMAPNEFHLHRVQERFGDVIRDAAAEAFGQDVVIDLCCGDFDFDSAVDPADRPQVPPPTHTAEITTGRVDHLEHKYTFDNFVVGSSNRFAHAAALAVSEEPGEDRYNPLFIYGAAGLGKTHLLHAIGHHVNKIFPTAAVHYVTSEKFLNEFIEALKRGRMDSFKDRYRHMDVLLLDDVQFLEGKQQLVQEFFHTFNALYDEGKQIVLSADRHPRQLATPERLRSRFGWGLITDVYPPDVETRLAILSRNAHFAAVSLPEEVLLFIAENISDNIRELEGALTRVTAYASFTAQEVTLDLARERLSDISPEARARPITPEEIIRATAATFDLPADDLLAPTRRQPIAVARQVAMYLCRDFTDLSLPALGKIFGRDHSTVHHAVNKIRGLVQTDRHVLDVVNEISQVLRRS